MTEQTSALKSKENNNVASKQPKPPMQKAAPGTTKRIFGYIFQYKWRVALVVVCILVGAAAQAGSSLFLQSLIDTYILPMVGATNPDWMPLLRALTLMACLYAAGIFCSWLWQWIIVAVEQGTLKKIRDDMFAHQQTLPIRYFDTTEPTTPTHCARPSANRSRKCSRPRCPRLRRSCRCCGCRYPSPFLCSHSL